MRKQGASPPTPTPPDEAFLAKLEESGLDLDDAEALGIESLAGPETQALHPSFKPLKALKLPYFDLDGQPLRTHPKHPPFYRLRYLEQGTDFKSLVAKKQPRYVQEPNSGVGAYFPRLLDWQALAEDPQQTLLITEGELKAAKACKEGFACIGLGGVWNFKSNRSGLTFLPELAAIDWVRRTVAIVYDSDFREKEGVVMALNALAEELLDRGAYPYVISLPELTDDAKTGLDDFLVHPAGGPEQLQRLMDAAQPLTLARPLWRLNEEVVYVRDPGLIMVQKSDQKVSPSQFKEHAFATAKYMEQQFKADGSVSLEKVSAAAAWLKWPLRHEVAKLTYMPGEPKFTEDPETRDRCYNTWPGWGCQPAEGDIQPWYDLLDHLFTGAEPGAMEWFLDWCAYPLQYPGAKLFSAVVIHGVHQGTGKSLLGYTLGKIYGKNFVEIRQADLHNGKNDWAEHKQFVLGDEVTGSDKRHDADTLKKLITQKTIRIDIKYVPTYELPDCINYLFTSNQPDSFFLEDSDRRFFIHEVMSPPLPEDFYAEYDLWLHGKGPQSLFYELLHRDLSGFNPAAPAFMTKAKQRMLADTRSDLGSWVRWLMQAPEQVLKVGRMTIDRDLVTNKDLLMIYDPDGHKKLTANGLGRELRRAGVPVANEGLPVRTSLGVERLYIVRNHAKWAQATPKELKEHVEQHEAQLAKQGLR